MRKQAKLMGFGLNYQHFADYQDKASVVEISYSNVPHLSNYRAKATTGDNSQYFRNFYASYTLYDCEQSGLVRR